MTNLPTLFRQPRTRFYGSFAAAVIVAWVVYSQALSGSFLLDDFSNLSKLGVVKDAESALYFALTGTGGPGGRPIAMASFLPQADHWGANAEPFIRVNVLIHLFNALLLFVFVQQLGRHLRFGETDRLFIALSTSALWLLMPLLASSVLMIVQRMTLLSGSFVLAGLNGYLYFRARIDSRPGSALVGMSVSLLVATPLAVLCKENGALLPVLLLVMEFTLLTVPPQVPPQRWRVWFGALLALPAIAVVAFLAWQLPYTENMIQRRGYNGSERLLTEARILWEYLLAAVAPRPGEFSPFHDAYPAARSLLDPRTLAATMAWLALAGGAVAWRRKYPVAAFSILWFLGAHLLESTSFPLELYFEHRNYIPIIGPVIGLVIAASRISGEHRKYARGAVAGLCVISAIILFSVTSIWGRPLQAATFWHLQQPESVRAATNLATQQMAAMGPGVALVTLQEYTARFPQHAYVGIPGLSIACSIAPGTDHSATVDRLARLLPAAAFSYTTITMLDELLSVVVKGQCQSVGVEDVVLLSNAALKNPAYGGNIYYRQLHHKLQARIARMSGDGVRTLEELTQALSYSRDDDLNMMIVTTLVEAGRISEAREFVDAARAALPRYPPRRIASGIYLRGLSDYVDEAGRLLSDPGETMEND